MFTRGNPYWGIVSTSWGFTIAPFAMIGAFLILIFLWLFRTRLRQGRWTWDIKGLKKVELADGVAPVVAPEQEETNLWRRTGHRILATL